MDSKCLVLCTEQKRSECYIKKKTNQVGFGLYSFCKDGEKMTPFLSVHFFLLYEESGYSLTEVYLYGGLEKLRLLSHEVMGPKRSY